MSAVYWRGHAQSGLYLKAPPPRKLETKQIPDVSCGTDCRSGCPTWGIEFIRNFSAISVRKYPEPEREMAEEFRIGFSSAMAKWKAMLLIDGSSVVV